MMMLLCVQEESLFVYENEDAYKERRNALDVIVLGACRACEVSVQEKQNKQHVFEITYPKVTAARTHAVTHAYRTCVRHVNQVRVCVCTHACSSCFTSEW